jgi:hypothetical protein
MSGTIAHTSTKDVADSTWRGIYKIGGFSLLLAGLMYLLGSTLGLYLGATPGDSPAYLEALANRPTLAEVMYWVFALTDILLLFGTLGLYLALKEINKSAMLVAASLLSLFIILDLGITELNSLALVALTRNIAAATSDTQRMAYQAGANWGLATMPLATFFSWFGPSCGFLVVSIVMSKSFFGKPTARFGMIVFILGIIVGFYFLYPVPILAFFLTPVLVIYGAWLIATGRRLHRLGKRMDEMD